MGVEVAIGALIAWMVSKARRAGKTLDGVADEVVDAGATRLRDAVLGKLGDDSAVRKLHTEITETGAVSDRTHRRVIDAVEAAADEDDIFRKDLAAAIEATQQQGGLLATHGGTGVSGIAYATGQGGVAIGAVGHDAKLGQMPDPHRPGRA
jgi:hypothetical protein